jgi:uncharacterized membrane protein YhaH (DUF805 family)
VKIPISDLWTWKGPIGRRGYFAWGVLLTAIKYSVDRLILASVAGHPPPWQPWGSWNPGDVFVILDPKHPRWGLTLAALPFVYTGVALTVRRLRSLDWSPACAVLFFVPFVNLYLFAILCLLSERSPKAKPSRPPPFLSRVLPSSALGSAVAAIVVTALVGTAFIGFCTIWFKSWTGGIYQSGTFLLGFFATLIYSYRAPRPFWECSIVGLLCLGMLCLLLSVLVTGLFGIVMATPIAQALVLIGTAVGRLAAKTLGFGPGVVACPPPPLSTPDSRATGGRHSLFYWFFSESWC